jgi:predicted ATP-dependent endonuclease of OLD family
VAKRQVTSEVFTGDTALDRKRYLRMVLDFDPSANELFFAKRVVLVEGDTEMAVLSEAAKLMGIFDKHPHLEHDVTVINCHGKWTIPAFQEVLNHFQIEYYVLVAHQDIVEKRA